MVVNHVTIFLALSDECLKPTKLTMATSKRQNPYPQLSTAKTRLHRIGISLVFHVKAHKRCFEDFHFKKISVLADPKDGIVCIFVPPSQTVKFLHVCIVLLLQTRRQTCQSELGKHEDEEDNSLSLSALRSCYGLSPSVDQELQIVIEFPSLC
jgi:hypothetical protein